MSDPRIPERSNAERLSASCKKAIVVRIGLGPPSAKRRGSHSASRSATAIAALAGWMLMGTFVPSNVRIATSERQLTFTTGAATLSTATLCAGFAFDQFGANGPTFSPDFHYVLVDVLGPFNPGDVERHHALVQVESGAIVRAPDFPQYFGLPATAQPLAWVSGERQSLHYADGKDHRVPDVPLHRFPASPCRL